MSKPPLSRRQMSKLPLSRRHTDAFLEYLIQMQTKQLETRVVAERRYRFQVHLTTMFWLHVQSRDVTTHAMADLTGLDRRTINSGFRELVDLGVVRQILVNASHGKGRAHQYFFTDDFVSEIMKIHMSLN